MDAKNYSEFLEEIKANWEQEALKWQKTLVDSPVDVNSIEWMIISSQQNLDDPAFYEGFE